MESLIYAVVRNLGSGATIEQIHDAARQKGWSEEDVFLAIKAGEYLYNAIVKQQQELQQEKLQGNSQ
jgi:hypothetical protein